MMPLPPIRRGPERSPSPFGRGAGGEGRGCGSCRDAIASASLALTLTLSQRERGPIRSHALRTTVCWAAAVVALWSWAAFCRAAADHRNHAPHGAPAGPAAEKNESKPPPQIGRFIPVTLPITGQTFDRTRRAVGRAVEMAKKQNVQLVLVFEFDVPKGQKDFGRGSDFAAAYSLANFLSSDELNGVRTVAYLPQPIEGHAVLPVIACQEIIMAKDATRRRGGDRREDPDAHGAERLRRDRRPAADPAGGDGAGHVGAGHRGLGRGDRGGPGVRHARGTERTQAAPRRQGAGGGEAGRRAGRVLRRRVAQRGLVKYLAAQRRDVARALELPPTAIAHDPSLEGGWKPVRVDLKVPVRFESVNQVQRIIKEQVEQNNVNFICLWIDSPGGSLVDAVRLANMLADLDPNKVRTVAYVPSRGPLADAAVVALACDQLVVGPRAVLGGPGAYQPTPDEIRAARQTIRDSLSKAKGRPWSLWAAMIDPRLNVFRAKRLGDVEYFCDEELGEQSDAAKWQKDALVTEPGRPLKLSGDAGRRLRSGQPGRQ